jgi:hypothetical protein
MKTLTISAFLLVVAIATSSFVISNRYVVKGDVSRVAGIGSFRAHRQGKDIALSWSAVGSAAASFQVMRSYDGEFYDVIGEVENTHASALKFQDENVPPGYLYYLITGVDAAGKTQEVSAVEVVRIVQRK